MDIRGWNIRIALVVCVATVLGYALGWTMAESGSSGPEAASAGVRAPLALSSAQSGPLKTSSTDLHGQSDQERLPNMAVLLTFHAKSQLEKANQTIRQHWLRYPACHSQTPSGLGLIFHVESAAAHVQAATLLDNLKALPHLRCFDRHVVTHASLTEKEDVWPLGPTRQFYTGLRQARAAGFDYVLQIEPDCIPIRDGWAHHAQKLAAIYEHLLPPEGLWMLGSMPLTEAVAANKRLAHRVHINGNAIYHVGSPVFMDMLQAVENNKANPAPWQESKHGQAYDVDIASFLFQSEHYRFTQKNMQHFVFHPFVANMWRAKWSAEELRRHMLATYLVHGGEMVGSGVPP